MKILIGNGSVARPWHAEVHLQGPMHEQFRKLARYSTEIPGSAETFFVACAAIVVWTAVGPRYNYSDTWQLVINTAATIITFLMLFSIQNTQNRDARAIQLKRDELIRAVTGLGQDWDEWRPPGKGPTQIARYLIQHSS